MKLTIATCQFPVSADIDKNYEYVSKQMRKAKTHGADVVHFPECALSGYAGHDLKSYRGYNWNKLEKTTKKIFQLARQLKIWVVFGSIHKLSGSHKPHNSIYIINNRGEIVDRYDKMFCSGNKAENQGDLRHYSPGNHFSIFKIKGIICGALICHDYRYPELYREYKKKGVQLMFHSYHAGGISKKQLKEIQKPIGKFANLSGGSTYPEITMPATMISYAGNNHVWISCSNSSRPESCWPSFFVRHDGVITGKLKKNVSGMLITTIDTNKKWYDSTVAWRDRAINGIYHSGTLVKDKRTTNRKKL